MSCGAEACWPAHSAERSCSPPGACACTTGRHRREGRLRPTAADPAAGRVHGRRRGAAGLHPACPDRPARLRHRGTTRTWGFNGDYLGPDAARPARRAGRGQRRQRPRRGHQRALARHAPAGPRWTAARTSRCGRARPGHRPGRSNQPAATLWYHPHPHGETARARQPRAGRHVHPRRRRHRRSAPLPHDYGVDDIPVDRAGQATSTTASSTMRPQLRRHSSATLLLVNGTVRALSDGGTDGSGCGC